MREKKLNLREGVTWVENPDSVGKGSDDIGKGDDGVSDGAAQ